MSTPHYQNVSIAQLQDWSKANPNRDHRVAPIRVLPPSADREERGTRMDAVCLPTYSAIPVPNLIGLMSYIRNPLFADALPSIKSTIMRDLVTTLQTETDTLAGSSFARKRRRIFDGIAAAFHGTPIKPEEWLDVYKGLAHMTQVHMVFLRHAESAEETEVVGSASKGTVSFSSDPATWDVAKPIWIVDWHGRWIAIPSDSEKRTLSSQIYEWLIAISNAHWIVEWPTVDATKEAIVEELSASPAWTVNSKKLKKDVLALQLGKYRAEKVLAGWR